MGPFGGEGGVGGGDWGWGVRARISQHSDLFCSFAMDDHAGIALRRSEWGRSVLGGGCRGVRGRAWGGGWGGCGRLLGVLGICCVLLGC